MHLVYAKGSINDNKGNNGHNGDGKMRVGQNKNPKIIY